MGKAGRRKQDTSDHVGWCMLQEAAKTVSKQLPFLSLQRQKMQALSLDQPRMLLLESQPGPGSQHVERCTHGFGPQSLVRVL